jgi:hypothetical protein
MTQAQSVLDDALAEILVNPSEAPLESDEVQSAIRALNRMVNAWNFAIGWTNVENVSDELTVIAAAEEALVKNLAIRLAPQFDGFVSQDLRSQAAGSLASLRRIVIRVDPASYPSRLPTGSGNHHQPTYYPLSDAEIVQEDGGSIILE